MCVCTFRRIDDHNQAGPRGSQHTRPCKVVRWSLSRSPPLSRPPQRRRAQRPKPNWRGAYQAGPTSKTNRLNARAHGWRSRRDRAQRRTTARRAPAHADLSTRPRRPPRPSCIRGRRRRTPCGPCAPKSQQSRLRAHIVHAVCGKRAEWEGRAGALPSGGWKNGRFEAAGALSSEPSEDSVCMRSQSALLKSRRRPRDFS